MAVGTALWLAMFGKAVRNQPVSTDRPPVKKEGAEETDEPVEVLLPEAWKAAFSAAPVKPPTAEEVRRARGFRTSGKKQEYLKLLEEFGSGGPEALPLLKAALNDPDQEIRRAAMRGLGRTETAEGEILLIGYAKDGVAIEESTEAALVLGQIKNPAVAGKMRDLLRQSQNPVLREHLIDALAGRPWEQTQAFFSDHLRDPNIGAEEKQNALAMLGMGGTAPAVFLTAALGDERDELRAGAYQGLAWRSETRESQTIRNSLARETDPEMRSLAYEAWGNQEDGNRAEILASYRAENVSEVRLRALKAWALVYGRDPTPGEPFLDEAVAILEQVAMTDPDPGERREALQALGATSTPEGRAALQRIAAGNSLRSVREMARSLSLQAK